MKDLTADMTGAKALRRARRGARIVALATAWLLMPALSPALETAPADNALPTLGDSGAQSLSPRAERRLGDRIMRTILQDPQVVDDPLIGEYVTDMWQSLLSSARQRGEISPELDEAFAWSSFLVRERSINAFALPGGYMGIHLGLIGGTRSRDELASVLAHELSHITQRHIARMISKSERTSWVSMASLVLGALAASRSPEAAQALIMGGQGLSAQTQLNFSRDMEREADRVGYGVLVQGGFAPAGMMQMFELLQQASRLNDDNSFPYLRTHPLTVERIGEARARMGTQGLGSVKALDAGLQHALIQTRAKVLMDTRSASLQPFLKAQEPAPNTSPLLAPYARLVAATQLKDSTQGTQALAQLWPLLGTLQGQEASAATRLVRLAEVEYLLETGRQAQATALARRLPAGRPETLLLAQAAAAAPDAAAEATLLKDALSRLQLLTSQQPADASAWTLQSILWGRVGEPLRALRADAEAAAARGDLKGAVDRVDAARQRFKTPQASDLIELSVMDARVQAWRKAIKEDERED